ncbi:MAG TPA: glutamate--tRNA ligase [Candidatus Peribacteria bacterium]|nr:glutamate--tRNA ligase [Candidatus Peribacteria bacterium]
MRTRFAPSPTGLLHIGGLRTALFAWLVAKQSGAAFTLRIEDTDKTREMAGATQDFVNTMTWAGLTIDEGVMLDENGAITEKGPYGPYHQSARLGLYKEHIDTLLKSGHAYRCFCTPERLDSMRKDQEKMKQPQMYDRLCHTLQPAEVEKRVAAGEKHVIRMLVPREKVITFKDEIYGHITFRGHTVDDQVLMKSDGFPTYHLAHVVDDHFMKMDIVIRGEEWISSLPKHLILFEMFGWTPPKYAHMPLLLNKDRSKLSKRQNDVAASHYIEKGYLPEAIINFLALLGWNPGTTQDVFTLDELIKQFSLERVQKSGAIFDLEKLEWLQGQWMRKMELPVFAANVLTKIEDKFPEAKNDSFFLKKAKLVQERLAFFKDAPEHIEFFYKAPDVSIEFITNEKQKVTKDLIGPILNLLFVELSNLSDGNWNYQEIKHFVEKTYSPNHVYAEKLANHALEISEGKPSVAPEIEYPPYTKNQILWTLRAALTGRKFSPGAFEVADALGKQETLKRLKAVKV